MTDNKRCDHCDGEYELFTLTHLDEGDTEQVCYGCQTEYARGKAEEAEYTLRMLLKQYGERHSGRKQP